jgi:Protein of unknown function (DUF2742)
MSTFGYMLSSRQVCWWDVHDFVSPLLTFIDSWPMVGTPAWCQLASDDSQKLAAVFDAAQHWALRVETCQEARCHTSHDFAAAFDWKRIAQASLVRNSSAAHGAYIPRVKR